MKTHIRMLGKGVTRVMAATLAALALVTTGAEAVDLRSWDQKIGDSWKRFIVLSEFSSEAVLDKESQLVWERMPVGPPLINFMGAFRDCASRAIGGRKGWRLPTIEELSSLVDPGRQFPALPSGHPFVLDATVGTYWSSTTDSFFLGSNALSIYIETGEMFSAAKVTDHLGRWCVRGGQGGDVR